MGDAAVRRWGFAAVLAAAAAVAALGLAEPLERRLLDLQFQALRAWHPRPAAPVAVVGIDDDTTRSLGERAVEANLRTLRAAVEAGRATELRMHPPALRPDRDGVVRRYGEGYIDYSRGPALDYVPFHRVLEWHAREEVGNLQREFAGRPVLVGTVVDDHAAPVQLADWKTGGPRMPAILLHAQALRTRPLMPLPKALAVAGVLAWFFATRWAGALLALGGLAVVLLASSAWLMTRGWVFPAGTALAVAALAAIARPCLGYDKRT